MRLMVLNANTTPAVSSRRSSSPIRAAAEAIQSTIHVGQGRGDRRVRRERHEQALGTLTTGTLDALGDPLRIQSRTSGGEPIIYTRDDVSNIWRSPGVCSSCGARIASATASTKVVCSIEIGSCSLQEEQML